MPKFFEWPLFDSLYQDVRYALRTMRRSPAFTAIALLSLALGIGANTAIFSLINTLMLQVLPVQRPQQLVELLQKYPGEPRGNSYWTWTSYEHLRDNNHVFSGLTGFSASNFTLRGKAIEASVVDGEYVAGNYFQLLGIRPAIGRLIGPEDNHTGVAGSAVAVVSWQFWKSRANLSPAILGQQITVDDTPLTIIGVTPPEFQGLALWSKPQVWLRASMQPLVSHARAGTTNGIGLTLVARLKPGVSLDQARAEMEVLYQFTIEERIGNNRNPDPLVRQLKVEVEPASTGLSFLRDQYAKPLIVLMIVVGLLLAIACINLAGLLLARAAARQNEIALRVSLGAGRLRLLLQVMIESLLLSVAGSLAGIWVAFFFAKSLVRVFTSGRQAPSLPAHLEIPVHLDGHVLFFTSCIAVLATMLFGFAPAVHAWSISPISSLRDGGKASGTKVRSLFGKMLVTVQVAVSMLLLCAAGLFVQHLVNLEHVNLGFRRDHLLLVGLNPSHSGYKLEQLQILYQQLLSRLQSIPGVASASLSGSTPLSGSGESHFARVEGHPERPEDRRYFSVNRVAPKYFETFGTPLLAGRDFSFSDQHGGLVAIINQTVARSYFGDSSPLGRHIVFDGESKPYEIIGVVGDAKYYEILEPTKKTIYLNAFQEWFGPSQFTIRTAASPSTIAPAVRRVVSDSLKTVPVSRIRTMEEQVDASIVRERLIATLSGWFGALGSILVAVGLYGLLAYTVTRRINEIGIRMALGATRTKVTQMVLRDALATISVGTLIGLLLAFLGKRLAASLFAELPVANAMPVVIGIAAMFCTGLVSAYFPARRAAHIDPMNALRHE